MTHNFGVPRVLAATDDTSAFNCGDQEIDTWFREFAYINQRAGMTKNFISSVGESIDGFYSLATGGLSQEDASARVTKGVARHSIPVIILARMGVDLSVQGRGLGTALLTDACLRVASISEDVGVRAFLIHAKNEQVRDFYLSFAEFEPSPTDPRHLILLMKDLRAAIH